MLKRFCSVAAVVLFAASPAGALSISGLTIAPSGTNTPDDITTNHTNNTSSTSILSSSGPIADAVDAEVSAATRYASNLWADAGAFDPAENVITTNSYDLSLSVSADAGTLYDITIDSLFQGILTRVDDSFFGESQAGVSAVTVTLNAAVLVEHGTSAQLLALGYYDETHSFSESGTSSLTGLSGTTNLVFAVTWDSNADNIEGDEAGVLIGLDEAGGPVGGVSAGEYGNLSSLSDPDPFASRNPADDGHFITVTAKVTSVVPEASTALLLAMGLAVTALGRRRS